MNFRNNGRKLRLLEVREMMGTMMGEEEEEEEEVV